MNLQSENHKILAILRGIPKNLAAPYALALSSSGIKFAEVAMNSDGALEQIEKIKASAHDDFLIGAGTVLNAEAAANAVSAGADFIVTPCVTESVLSYCVENGIFIIPGVFTPTDVSVCVSYGIKTMKLFPAGDMPMSYVKSLKGPFADTEYYAVGGVTRENTAEFIKAGYIGVGVGGGLCDRKALLSGDFETVRGQLGDFVAKLR